MYNNRINNTRRFKMITNYPRDNSKHYCFVCRHYHTGTGKNKTCRVITEKQRPCECNEPICIKIQLEYAKQHD